MPAISNSILIAWQRGGIPVGDLHDALRAELERMSAGNVVDGQRRVPMMIRRGEFIRRDAARFADLHCRFSDRQTHWRGADRSVYFGLWPAPDCRKCSRLNHLGPSRGWCRSEVGAREGRSRNQTAITSTDVHNRAFPHKSCLPDFHKASLTTPALNERLISTIVTFPSNGSFVGGTRPISHLLIRHNNRSLAS
jgi:hypothetical protein